MSISNKMQESMNIQIQKELFSEYFYLSMQAYFASLSLDGFANFFKVQTQEEHVHAMMFFDYVIETGGKVELLQLDKPQKDFQSPLSVFEKALEHEKFITKSIHELVNIAIEEKDYTANSFLQWFVDEQREEESTFDKIVQKLKLIGNDSRGLLMLDAELATRVFTPPATGKA
jgi:ferritin